MDTIRFPLFLPRFMYAGSLSPATRGPLNTHAYGGGLVSSVTRPCRASATTWHLLPNLAALKQTTGPAQGRGTTALQRTKIELDTRSQPQSGGSGGKTNDRIYENLVFEYRRLVC